MLKRIVLALVLALSLPVTAKPMIAASIRPLALIADELSAGVADVVQLLPDGDVPHHYSMGFADRRQLLEADLVLWVGPNLEGFYARAVTVRPADSVIGMADLGKSPRDANAGVSQDPHLWLNPDYGLRLAVALRTWLKTHYPESADRIEANYLIFRDNLQRTERDVTRRLARVADRRFVAGHGAFVHFADHFGLVQVAAMEHNSGVSASIQELSELLREQQITCFIVEPQYRQHRAERMAEYLKAKIRVVDPLAVNIERTSGAYGQLIETVGAAFADCLGDRSAIE